MIDCQQYRRALLADPQFAASEWERHCESCAECAQFTSRLRSFENRLARAARLPVAPPADNVVPLRPAGPRGVQPRGWGRRGFMRQGRFAIAASVLLGACLAAGLWLVVPRSSLAEDVVTHMAGEPDAWRRTEAAVSQRDLGDVLRAAHMRLSAGAGTVSYVRSCAFRGHQVPHFVVQGASGPVTVMVLIHESVRGEVRFDEHGYRGVLVPVAGHGAVAVLMRGGAVDSKSVERIASQLIAAIEWTA
jgi:hypothetical protein